MEKGKRKREPDDEELYLPSLFFTSTIYIYIYIKDTV